MKFFSFFKKALLILLSLGLISTVNAMETNETYFIATSANCKTLMQTNDFKFVTDNSRDAIENIVDNKSQNIIFMIKGAQDNILQKIPEIFENFVNLSIKAPKMIFKNFLYSGGLEKDEMKMEEEDGEASHNLLVAGNKVKQLYYYAIENVYAPSLNKGYNVGPNQARVHYKITALELMEFWHTEPAAMEQFLIWKHTKNPPIKNVILVSEKPMCDFCSRFLLHSFYIESSSKVDINFIVLSLPKLEDLAKFQLKDFLSTAIGKRTVKRGVHKGEQVDFTLLDGIKLDLKGTSGNNLCIYGF